LIEEKQTRFFIDGATNLRVDNVFCLHQTILLCHGWTLSGSRPHVVYQSVFSSPPNHL